MTTAPAPTITPATSYPNSWQKAARAGFQVLVEWRYGDGGYAVSGQVRDLRGGDHQPFAISLRAGSPHTETVMLTHSRHGQLDTFVDVTLTVRHEGAAAALVCNLPVSDHEYFNAPIAEWSLVAPTPLGPYPTASDTLIIDAPQDASDLFPFVWLEPLNAAETAETALRFVSYAGYASLPLYTSLAAATDADAKRSAASGYTLLSQLSSLGDTVARMPAARRAQLSLTGEVSVDDQLAQVAAALQLPEGTTVADFLAGSQWQTAEPTLWQNLYAIALVGVVANAALAVAVTETLQMGHYMSLLVAPEAAVLTTQASRQLALKAIAALPDAVAAQAPTPMLTGGGTSTNPNLWEVLGLGHLKMARQRLVAYTPGEVAEVVNVMPRERQESLERSVEQQSAQTQHSAHQHQEQDDNRQNSASSELADTVTEVMAADGLVRNMSGITPTYNNLNLNLSGTWAGSGAQAGWEGVDRSSLVQRLTEQAAKRVGERVSQQRGQAWQALRERQQSQVIDNSQHDRLVGIYRWVDRLVNVHLEPQGQRLILAFLIDQPSAPWQAQVLSAGPLPPTAPVPLPAPATGQAPYTVVTADNYQALGAAYGLNDLPAPPPTQITCTATVNRVALSDASLLVIPEGYSAQSGSVTIALADSSFGLVCAVAGETLAPVAPGSAAAISVTTPTCTTSSAGPAALTPPGVSASSITALALSKIANATGPVPITVMSSAPLFAVNVDISCSLTGSAATNPLMLQWQIRTYSALLAAWQAATERYEAQRAARIQRASAGRTGEVQRETLEQACLTLLTQVSHTGTDARSLAPLFSWAHMTWQYQNWPVGHAQAWPPVKASEVTKPGGEALFQRFLHAPTASVLLPVSPGLEAFVLAYLQFQQFWVGGPATTPITASTLNLIETLHFAPGLPPGHPKAEPGWTLRVPTPMLYLQESATLPGSQQPLPLAQTA